jgi:hypothetical protein
MRHQDWFDLTPSLAIVTSGSGSSITPPKAKLASILEPIPPSMPASVPVPELPLRFE